MSPDTRPEKINAVQGETRLNQLIDKIYFRFIHLEVALYCPPAPRPHPIILNPRTRHHSDPHHQTTTLTH